MRPLLATALLFLCLSARGQGGSVVGNVNSLIGGELICADGVMYSDGSPAGYPNCLYMPQPEEYLNGYVITWPSVTNHPTLAPYDRTLIYDLYIATNSSAWVLVQEIAPAPSDPMHLVWVPKDYWFGSGPTPTNVYFTVKASLLDATNVPTPAWAYWQYSTNCIGCQTNDPSLSTGAENAVPGLRFFTNSGPLNLVYLGKASVGSQVALTLESNSYSRNSFIFSLDPNNPASLTNAAGCSWWIEPTIYTTANAVLGCGGSRSVSYDMHELGNKPFNLGHADTVQRSGSGFINTVDGGDGLDAMYEFGGGVQFNTFYLEQLGWAGAYGDRPIYYSPNNGIFTITCTAASSAGAKAVKIPRETTKVYSLYGGFQYQTNTFYYLETMSFYPLVGVPAVVVRLGTPMPYRAGAWSYWLYTPHSKRVLNYGHSGGLITGDTFSDTYHYREVRTGISTNDTYRPFSVIVLSVTTTNATIAVTGL